MSLSDNIPYARPWILNQLAEDISLEDPIYVRPSSDLDTDNKDLLLSKPTLMTLHVTCVGVLQIQKFQKLLSCTLTTKP